MTSLLLDKPELFEAFIKSAQYIVRLQTQQDIWSHIGALLRKFFPVAWTAYAERASASREMTVHRCTWADPSVTQAIQTREIEAIISDVLDSGFLTYHVVPTPIPAMTAFLPIVEQGRPRMVMLVGHASVDPIPRELLNVYLAITGIAGSTFERLNHEIELRAHRAHLEGLVQGRTAELAKAKHQTELILHSVGEGICGLDLEGRITFINPSAARTLGWEPDQLMGRNAHDTFHHTRPDGSPYPVEQCPIHSALTLSQTIHGAGSLRETNVELVRKDGTRFPVELLTTPIIEAGKGVGAVMVFRDITERRLAEEALRKAHEELRQYADRLEATNKELEDFSYSVSHDLRSPLRAIAGFARMILDSTGPAFDSETRSRFDVIVENAQRMGRLIDDLLRLSRLGRSAMSRSKLDMANLVAEVLAELRMAEPDRDYVVDIGELPALEADRAMTRQLLSNLLANAVKFTRGRQDARIEVGSFMSSGELIYYVKDNGVGFDMKYYDKLFGVFQRLVSEREFEGTGAGLAIVERIVQRHGGRVWAEAELGQGATFFFTLPSPLHPLPDKRSEHGPIQS